MHDRTTKPSVQHVSMHTVRIIIHGDDSLNGTTQNSKSKCETIREGMVIEEGEVQTDRHLMSVGK